MNAIYDKNKLKTIKLIFVDFPRYNKNKIKNYKTYIFRFSTRVNN